MSQRELHVMLGVPALEILASDYARRPIMCDEGREANASDYVSGLRPLQVIKVNPKGAVARLFSNAYLPYYGLLKKKLSARVKKKTQNVVDSATNAVGVTICVYQNLNFGREPRPQTEALRTQDLETPRFWVSPQAS